MKHSRASRHSEAPGQSGQRFVDGDIRSALIYAEASALARQARVQALASALQAALWKPPRR